jgi:hypothetical protein
MNESMGTLVPIAVAQAFRVVDRDLGDPVDRREAGRGAGMRDRIEHDAMAMSAEADERRAAANRNARSHAAPHDRPAPMYRRLRRMHLRPHGRVQAVGADQELRAQLGLGSAARANDDRDVLALVAITDDAVPREHGPGTEALDRRIV